MPLLFFGCLMFVCMHVFFYATELKEFIRPGIICLIGLHISHIKFHFTEVSSSTELTISKTTAKFDFNGLLGT